VRITNRIRRRVPKSVVVGTACAAALAAWAGASAIDTTNPASAGDDNGARGRPARNVVLFIGDGMGAAHRTFFREALKGHTGELAMDALPVAGVQHTDSEDPKAPITDSAAAGTAIATGVKTFNGAVGVDSDGRRVRSVLEAARDRGRATGLVTTSQVTDATPASFAAHTSDRGRQSEIARQYIEETKPDVILGGGEDWWLPAGDPGATCRTPSSAWVAQRQAARPVRERGDVPGASRGSGRRVPPRVSLADMTAKVLRTLGRSRKGFFLMVEEEAIDEMSHQNNARRTLEAGKALDRSVAVARRYAATHPDTLVLVTADHNAVGSRSRTPPTRPTRAATSPGRTGRSRSPACARPSPSTGPRPATPAATFR
jgi:alkaline phosphatase